ncbi:hypothetical protein AWH62_02720 [Maricaulis sp. W15]|uniref:YkvA family protein n=1 Tax=Maricaulis sp. W15 TaxID=1772333 RepID=UPI0009489A42|nr:YkvA family protein [Maricaulis sp. W15]OLF81600.1 hypothetical protein AWH62_02720 [Maricaulis sp. W15]
MTNSSTPTLKVEFELSESDLAFFRDRLDKAREDRADLDEGRITAGVADMITKALAANPPEFVKTRLRQLGPLVGMLDDAEWKLEGEDRERVLNALAYFVDPDDLIPDSTPGIGYIDDAIMIELVAAGLAPELEAYAEFVAHREDLKAPDSAPKPPLEEVRKVMQDRMRRRRGRAKAGGLWSHSTVIRHYF